MIQLQISYEKVQEGNNQEKAQTERNSHSKKPRWEVTKLTIRYLYSCCEPLQKLRVRLGICKIRIMSACNFILLIVPRRYFCGGSYRFYVLVFKFFLCCWHLIYVIIF